MTTAAERKRRILIAMVAAGARGREGALTCGQIAGATPARLRALMAEQLIRARNTVGAAPRYWLTIAGEEAAQ